MQTANGSAHAHRRMHFSTHQVPLMQRQAIWTEQIQAFAGPCRITFGENDFEGRLDVGEIAGFNCARLRQNARAVQRSAQDLNHADPGYYYLILQLNGCTTVTQGTHSCLLQPGDLTLADPVQPSAMRFGVSGEQLTVHLPRAAVDRFTTGETLRFATALRGAPAMVLGGLLRPVFGEPDAFNTVQSEAVAEALLKLVAGSWQSNPTQRKDVVKNLSDAPMLRVIQNYIAHNLASPGLSPSTIAATHQVSVRHVHRLFSSVGTTVGEWLRTARLERCAADLRDHAHSRRSITDIAYDWGFNESAHFSRSFKTAYGRSPRQYRQGVEAEVLTA